MGASSPERVPRRPPERNRKGGPGTSSGPHASHENVIQACGDTITTDAYLTNPRRHQPHQAGGQGSWVQISLRSAGKSTVTAGCGFRDTVRGPISRPPARRSLACHQPTRGEGLATWMLSRGAAACRRWAATSWPAASANDRSVEQGAGRFGGQRAAVLKEHRERVGAEGGAGRRGDGGHVVAVRGRQRGRGGLPDGVGGAE